jgi:hypothetical protein
MAAATVPSFRAPIAIILALAALCLCLVLGAGSASAGGFTKCGPKDKLSNNGIIGLRAMNTKCRLARQVANRFVAGDETPKGFTCMQGVGGNLIPITCVRTASVVKFGFES